MDAFRGSKAVGDVKLATHLDVVPRLRMSGDVTLLPPYAFMVWTRTDIFINFMFVTNFLSFSLVKP